MVIFVETRMLLIDRCYNIVGCMYLTNWKFSLRLFGNKVLRVVFYELIMKICNC